ncbi:MAG: hypothetical protein IKJ07_05500 [Clostridia bacterium]|nr:hypothetical protein [Clostridia bacterium]
MNDQENLATERGSPSGNDYLSGILKGIMSTPTDSDPSDRDFSTTAATTPSAPQTNPSADIFSALLSNPELLSKLPALISSIKPMLDMLGMGAGSAPTSATVSTNTTHGDNNSIEAGAQIKKHSADDRRAALLCAMKPYLSRDRQQAVDYILKLSRLGDVLKSL